MSRITLKIRKDFSVRNATTKKRWLLGTHQGAVESVHLQAYLDEYVFRFNRRKSTQRGLLFYRLLESATNTETITYAQLTNHYQ
jgi:hypothetical protein